MEAEKDAKAKEERIELLRKQATRRIMNRDLMLGWGAWDEYVTAKAYAMNRLREVGNRFRAPELANAFGWWVRLYTTLREKAKLADCKGEIVGVEDPGLVPFISPSA